MDANRRSSTPNTSGRLARAMAHAHGPELQRVRFRDDMGLEEIPEVAPTYDRTSTPQRRTDLVRFLSQEALSSPPPDPGKPRKHLKALFMLPTLANRAHMDGARIQEELLKACEAGSTKAVEELLEADVEFNVNATDFLGRTPLQIALEKEDMQMINLLLPKSSISNIEATLLHAINESKDTIACNIIRHERYSDMIYPLMKRLGTQRGLLNSDFTSTSGFYLDTTPLILAAQRELYTVVKLLLLQGSKIARPHSYDCPCGICEDIYNRDYMRYAHRRLNAYRGLTSTSYITLGSQDPFSEVFALKKEVLGLSTNEKYFKAEYAALAKKLSEFLVKLIDNIRGTRELDMILNKTDGERDDGKMFEPMARLRYAVVNKEKMFVAHPSCQMKLNCVWFDRVRYLQRCRWWTILPIFALFALVYPGASTIHNFFPSVEKLSILDAPVLKFMAHAYSFFLFLSFLTVRTFAFHTGCTATLANVSAPYQREFSRFFRSSQDNPSSVVTRHLDFYIVDSLITLWVIGMLWQKCRRIFDVGAREHVARYNIYEAIDTAMIFLFSTSYTLQWVVLTKANRAVDYFSSESNLRSFLQNQNGTALTHWYFLNPDRFYWMKFDPALMSEILFAAANILSFSRISYLLAANETLGPLQISLGRMTSDILRFVVLFGVLFIAFMLGIDNLLWPFADVHREATILTRHANSNNETMAAGAHFGSILDTFRSLFWMTFGLTEYDTIDMKPYGLIITQNAAYVLLGAHIFCIVIVMLNMLIAMMSRSFDKIAQEADVEFKFARSGLYLEYCDRFSPQPVPLNLLPTAKQVQAIVNFLKKLRGSYVKEKDVENQEMSRVGGSLGKGRRHKELYKELEKINYIQTIKSIVQRFISDVTKNDDDDGDNNIDVVRQDILRMRTEMTSDMVERQLQENGVVNQLNDVKTALDDVRRQQEDIMQQFGDCLTKLNTFENMVSSNLRRHSLFSARHDLSMSDDESVDAQQSDATNRAGECAIS